MSELPIEIPREAVAALCRRYGVGRLSLFGSILTPDFRADSDVDMLVEFLPETRIGFFGMGRLQVELSDLLGRRVDLRTPDELSRYFRADVVREARVEYVA